MLEKVMTIEQPAGTSYKDKEVLDFELILDNKLKKLKLKKAPYLFSNTFQEIVTCSSKSRCRYLRG